MREGEDKREKERERERERDHTELCWQTNIYTVTVCSLNQNIQHYILPHTVGERERESVCVRERKGYREIKRESVCMCVSERERERKGECVVCVCVCVFMWPFGREGEQEREGEDRKRRD